MKNYKALFWILGVLSVLVIVVVLSSTVFTLKTIEVIYYDKNNQVILADNATYNKVLHEEDKPAIIDGGEFDMGQNIFLLNKQHYIDNLEKNTPYAKVLGLTIHFPNRLVIHIQERSETFAIQTTDTKKYIVTDGELKVLCKKDSLNSEYDAIELKNITLNDIDATLGAKLLQNNQNLQIAGELEAGLRNCFDIFPQLKNKVIKQFFESVTFSTGYNGNENGGNVTAVKLVIKTRDDFIDDDGVTKIPMGGIIMEIFNADDNLALRLNKAKQIFEYIVNININSDYDIIGDPSLEENSYRMGKIQIYYNLKGAYVKDT